ncbi:MAG: HAD family hydrolase [Flavobacteriales bacterium]|nr:HAD family hydrolase [Flavobacteriales bacterium]
MNSRNYSVKAGSALFIDRDGVINELRVQDYVKSTDEFILLPDVINALAIFRRIFKRIFIVTNQQGVGKKLMIDPLETIHQYMLSMIPEELHPDAIYHCPHLSSESCTCRKPKTGMALMAKNDYPEIQFTESFMIGDSDSDMQFAQNCGMVSFRIDRSGNSNSELTFKDLLEVANYFAN